MNINNNSLDFNDGIKKIKSSVSSTAFIHYNNVIKICSNNGNDFDKISYNLKEELNEVKSNTHLNEAEKKGLIVTINVGISSSEYWKNQYFES